LGLPPTAILIGNGREPIWPRNVVGSITHCSGYCAAVATNSPLILSIGIDAEENLPLPDGVAEIVATVQERADISNMNDPSIAWDRLLFSAKEAVFKAWYSLAREWLEFSDCCIVWDPCRRPSSVPKDRICGDFIAKLKRPCTTANRLIEVFQGHYIASPTHLATLVQVC
jgi:4'-phosphopantetheinyl transferase EntD